MSYINKNIPSSESLAPTIKVARILTQALHFFEKGSFEQASILCRHALELDPQSGVARLLLARRALEHGDTATAEQELCDALRHDSHNLEISRELIGLYIQQGRETEALELALGLKSSRCNEFDALLLAAQTAEALNRPEQAALLHLDCWHARLDESSQPKKAIRLFLKAFSLDKALDCCTSAIKEFPGDADFMLLASQTFQAKGQALQAEKMARNALALASENAEAWFQLGTLCHTDALRTQEAEDCYRQALKIKPGWSSALTNLGALCYGRHDLDAARQIWGENDSSALRAKSALALEIIPANIQSVEKDRQRLMELRAQDLEGGSVSNPVNKIGFTNFYTAYHNLSNRELHQNIANIHLHLCPRLGRSFVAKGLQHKPRRIGVISRYFKMHTISDYFAHLLRMMQDLGLQLTVFTFEREKNPILELLAEGSKSIVRLQSDLWLAAETIAAEKLDLLLYLDIGMDPLTYYLAFSRLAPLQCTLYGHPDTTGIPAVDVFISPQIMETEGAQAQYSERLAALPGLLSGIPSPLNPPILSRRELGLPEGRTLYLCPQSLFKLHPLFDDTLRSLLKNDPDALLLLFRAPNPTWNTRLESRLGLGHKLVWLEQTSSERFLALCRSADAVLDSPSFSGGATSYKLLGTATPVITWEGGFMRARQTAGLYAHLQIDDLAARDERAFITCAQRMAHDRIWKNEVQTMLVERAPKLFETRQNALNLKKYLQDPN